MSSRYITAAIVLAALVVALFMIRPHPVTPAETEGSVPKEDWKRSAFPDPQETRVVILPIAADAIRLDAPDGNCRDDIAFLDLVISQYRRHLDGNPVGDNGEISAALRGDNPKGIALLPRGGKFLNGAGQLVDRWGTPYFFHAIASQRMDIVSAGPDREFWTADDITSHPASR